MGVTINRYEPKLKFFQEICMLNFRTEVIESPLVMSKVIYANGIACCPPYTSDLYSFVKGTYTPLKH